jgi:hypothetical protein
MQPLPRQRSWRPLPVFSEILAAWCPMLKHPLCPFLIAHFFGPLYNNARKLIVTMFAIEYAAIKVGSAGSGFEVQTTLAFMTIIALLFGTGMLDQRIPRPIAMERLEIATANS